MLDNTSTSTFGLVCSDGFGPEEATVVCRDLGYPHGLEMCCSAFGHMSSSPILRTNLQCIGREHTLQDCLYSVSMSYCPSRKYASVICSNLSPNTGESLCLWCGRHFDFYVQGSVTAVFTPPTATKAETTLLYCVALLPLQLFLSAHASHCVLHGLIPTLIFLFPEMYSMFLDVLHL